MPRKIAKAKKPRAMRPQTCIILVDAATGQPMPIGKGISHRWATKAEAVRYGWGWYGDNVRYQRVQIVPVGPATKGQRPGVRSQRFKLNS